MGYYFFAYFYHVIVFKTLPQLCISMSPEILRHTALNCVMQDGIILLDFCIHGIAALAIYLVPATTMLKVPVYIRICMYYISTQQLG